jgi:hypothetical protein
MKKLLLVCAATLVLSACATKQYGRVQELSSTEKELYTCREIQLEYDKLAQFESQIDETGGFNGKTVLGFLGDFGIGNGMAKKDARVSARERREDLDNLSARKQCTFGNTANGSTDPGKS